MQIEILASEIHRFLHFSITKVIDILSEKKRNRIYSCIKNITPPVQLCSTTRALKGAGH